MRLYLNDNFFRVHACSVLFCQSENESQIHLFYGCIKTNLLWYRLKISKNKNRSSCKHAAEYCLWFSKLFKK